VKPAPACVCGGPCRPPFRASTGELAPDLDGRPGEPAAHGKRHAQGFLGRLFGR